MKKLIAFLSAGYAIYALLVGWYLMHVFVQVHDAQATSDTPLTAAQLVPLVTLTVMSGLFIVLFILESVLLARAKARRTMLVIAAVSCIGIPIGTILGALTIYALTRPQVTSESMRTA